MSSIDLLALPGAVFRPLIVAIVHVPILILTCFTIPVWLIAVALPKTHGDFALKLLRELRTWSRDAVSAAGGMRRR